MSEQKDYWEKKLASEGMSAELDDEQLGERVDLGDGLGNKSEEEEDIEDSGVGHSRMCPINLGHSLDESVDQPNDRPLEKK